MGKPAPPYLGSEGVVWRRAEIHDAVAKTRFAREMPVSALAKDALGNRHVIDSADQARRCLFGLVQPLSLQRVFTTRLRHRWMLSRCRMSEPVHKAEEGGSRRRIDASVRAVQDL